MPNNDPRASPAQEGGRYNADELSALARAPRRRGSRAADCMLADSYPGAPSARHALGALPTEPPCTAELLERRARVTAAEAGCPRERGRWC